MFAPAPDAWAWTDEDKVRSSRKKALVQAWPMPAALVVDVVEASLMENEISGA